MRCTPYTASTRLTTLVGMCIAHLHLLLYYHLSHCQLRLPSREDVAVVSFEKQPVQQFPQDIHVHRLADDAEHVKL